VAGAGGDIEYVAIVWWSKNYDLGPSLPSLPVDGFPISVTFILFLKIAEKVKKVQKIFFPPTEK